METVLLVEDDAREQRAIATFLKNRGYEVLTASDGTARVDISAVSDQVPPDTAIVQVRAERVGGEPVPGSGQRFIVLFQ